MTQWQCPEGPWTLFCQQTLHPCFHKHSLPDANILGLHICLWLLNLILHVYMRSWVSLAEVYPWLEQELVRGCSTIHGCHCPEGQVLHVVHFLLSILTNITICCTYYQSGGAGSGGQLNCIHYGGCTVHHNRHGHYDAHRDQPLSFSQLHLSPTMDAFVSGLFHDWATCFVMATIDRLLLHS